MPATAGVPTTVTVTAEDQYGNITPAYSGTVKITSSDAAAVLPANNTLTNGVGTFTVTLQTAGPQTVTASDTANNALTQTSNPITVSAAATSQLVLSGVPTATTAGAATTVTVTAEDQFGNITPAYSGTVRITSSDAAAVLPADNTLTNGVGQFTVILQTAGLQSLTATDIAISSLNQTSNAFLVVPGATTQLVLSGVPSSFTAGVPTTFTVTAEDQFGNITPAYAGTVQITSSDAAATVPADNTLTNGVGTFTTTFLTAGQQSLTASDVSNPQITASATAMVTPVVTAPAVSLSLTVPPNAVAGQAFNFTVTAVDSLGNTVTGYAGIVSFTTTDPQGAFGTNSATLTNGIGTFSATLKTAGSWTIAASGRFNVNVPLIFNGTSNITGTSNPIMVSAAAAAGFTVVAPANVVAGNVFGFTVTAFDAFGNIATGYTGTVQIASSDAAAILPANGTLTNGVGTFTATLETAGLQTLTAADTTNVALNQSSNLITVSPTLASQFVVLAPVNAVAGNAVNLTVVALDAFGNIATGYAGTVNFTTTDPLATAPASITLANGVGTIGAILKTAGVSTITATDSINGALNGTSNPIAVSPAATSQFVFSGVQSTLTLPNQAAFTVMAVNFTVTAEDPFDNVTPGYAGTVSFATSDPSATIPGNMTLANGTGVFSATLRTAGVQTLTATDTANGNITGSSTVIPVTVYDAMEAAKIIAFANAAVLAIDPNDPTLPAVALALAAHDFGDTDDLSDLFSQANVDNILSLAVFSGDPTPDHLSGAGRNTPADLIPVETSFGTPSTAFPLPLGFTDTRASTIPTALISELFLDEVPNDLITDNIHLYWFNSSQGIWQLVQSQGSQANIASIVPAPGKPGFSLISIFVTFGANSSPQVTQLTGTVFSVAIPAGGNVGIVPTPISLPANYASNGAANNATTVLGSGYGGGSSLTASLQGSQTIQVLAGLAAPPARRFWRSHAWRRRRPLPRLVDQRLAVARAAPIRLRYATTTGPARRRSAILARQSPTAGACTRNRRRPWERRRSAKTRCRQPGWCCRQSTIRIDRHRR